MMTKKDFIKLADVLRRTKPDLPDPPKHWTIGETFCFAQWKLDLTQIGDFCKASNPRFNRQIWLDYIDGKCGPNGGKLK